MRRRTAIRIALCSSILCLGFLIAAVRLFVELETRGGITGPAGPRPMDPDVKAAVIARLVESGTRYWDSHPDPDVGRVAQPNIKRRRFGPVFLETNRFGLREREFVVPKPEGLVRVVLLGDSFVFGNGVEAQDRLGVFLEEQLREHSGAEHPRVEVLHVGIASWNIQAECAYLRRALSLLDPDLVIQVLIPNDLEDCGGVRGFGALSKHSSQRRHVADATIKTEYGQTDLGTRYPSFVPFALDHTSRGLYERASNNLQDLDDRLRALGIPYLVLANWYGFLPICKTRLVHGIDERQVLYLPTRIAGDATWILSAEDMHWSREGHEKVAQVLYARIVSENLLPDLELKPDQGARALHDTLTAEGLREASLGPGFDFDAAALTTVSTRLEFPMNDDSPGHQVYGGIERGGTVLRECNLILKRDQGRSLRLRGLGLDRADLDAVVMEVDVDGKALGTFTVHSGQPVEVTFDLSESSLSSAAVAVRLYGRDYAYAADLRSCVTFQLIEIAIE